MEFVGQFGQEFEENSTENHGTTGLNALEPLEVCTSFLICVTNEALHHLERAPLPNLIFMDKILRSLPREGIPHSELLFFWRRVTGNGTGILQSSQRRPKQEWRTLGIRTT